LILIEVPAEHNTLNTLLSQFNVVFAYCDHGSRPHTFTLSFSRDEGIYVFQIQSKNYISKSIANPKTKSCINPNSYYCC